MKMTSMFKTQEHPMMVEATAHIFTLLNGKVYEFVNIDGTDQFALSGSSNYYDAAQFGRAKENAISKGAVFTESRGWTFK
jgi:hypothetical protein